MITVVVPVHNEQGNIRPLIEEIIEAADKDKAPIDEIIYVDDKSTDDTLEVLKRVKSEYPQLKIIRHNICTGQSAAFMTGVRSAKNDIVVLMDGDRQNDPKDIEKLYSCYMEKSKDNKKIIVAGEREKRHDNLLRRISSRLANKIRSSLLKDKTRDTGCSLKLVQKETYLRLPYFKHMHRFIPALMIRENASLYHVPVSHRPRTAGVSKYGFWNRFWVGIVDLLGVKWLIIRGLPENFSSDEID